jgi:hypothetical protein
MTTRLLLEPEVTAAHTFVESAREFAVSGVEELTMGEDGRAKNDGWPE